MPAVEVHTMPVRRFSVRTAKADEAYAYLRASIGDHRWHFRVSGPTPTVVGQSAQVDGLGAIALTVTDAAYQVLRPAQDDLVFWTQLAGRGAYQQHGEDFSAGPGTIGLYRPGAPVRCRTEDFGVRALSLLPGMVSRVAAELGVDDGPVVFHSGHPINADLADHWRHSMMFVTDRLLATGGADRMPELVVGQLARFAAHAALATFPNSTTTAARLRGPGRFLPAAIRRATAYIDEHAAEPLTLADIARAAGLHPRTLEAGFARLDTTPMTYLRRVRLQHAHEELVASDPSTGATVGAIAARWGFGHPGRFSALYRRTFGRPPSDVLRD